MVSGLSDKMVFKVCCPSLSGEARAEIAVFSLSEASFKSAAELFSVSSAWVRSEEAVSVISEIFFTLLSSSLIRPATESSARFRFSVRLFSLSFTEVSYSSFTAVTESLLWEIRVSISLFNAAASDTAPVTSEAALSSLSFTAVCRSIASCIKFTAGRITGSTTG